MIKYLLLALLIAWLFFSSPWARPRPGKPQAKRQTAPPSSPQAMVACAHCGVHLPSDDALIGFGTSDAPRYFCSEVHRKAGPRSP